MQGSMSVRGLASGSGPSAAQPHCQHLRRAWWLVVGTLLATLALCAGMPGTAHAADYTSGDFAYRLSSGTAVIEGYTGSDTALEIPSTLDGYTVTGIGNYAFSGRAELTSVSFPSTLESIGGYAFKGCSGLISLTLPKAISTINVGAFENCVNLTSLTVNCGDALVTSSGTFQYAGTSGTGLAVTFTSSCTAVPAHFFYTSSSSETPYVTSVTISYKVTEIGEDAFTGLSGYTLYGYKGSAAWYFAQENDVTFSKLGTVMSYLNVKLSKTSYIYNGKSKKPAVTVKSGGAKLKKGTQYTVSYASVRKAIGTYTVRVKGVNSAGYYGSVTKTFKVKPAKVKLKSLKASGYTLLAKWKKASGGVKYQVAYRTKYRVGTSSYSSWQTVKTGKLKKKLSHLNYKSRYQVRVRAYKVVDGVTYYGKWSKVKTVNVG